MCCCLIWTQLFTVTPKITPIILRIRGEKICVIVTIATSPFSLFSSQPRMRTNQNLGRGDWAKIVLHIYYIYSIKMHLTKSNLHSRNNLFKVIAYTCVNQIYLTSIFLRKHYFAQGELPDAKLNHSGLLESCGRRAWQPCAWSDQMKLRKRLAISQIVSTLMHSPS